jgi:hypothetical protein
MKKFFLIAVASTLLLASCITGGTRGSGHVISKQFNETGFKNIDISSVMKVYLKQGDKYEVKVEAEDNILDLMEVTKDGDKLEIGFRNSISVSPTKDIVIYITAPDFHELSASGAGGYVSEGTIKTSEISLDLSGATKVKLALDVTSVKVDASGASEIILSGNTQSLEVDGSGSTDVSAFDLKSQMADIGISGSGSAKVQVEKNLKVEISGAGDVVYKGNPSITKDISGAGSVSAAK